MVPNFKISSKFVEIINSIANGLEAWYVFRLYMIDYIFFENSLKKVLVQLFDKGEVLFLFSKHISILFFIFWTSFIVRHFRACKQEADFRLFYIYLDSFLSDTALQIKLVDRI